MDENGTVGMHQRFTINRTMLDPVLPRLYKRWEEREEHLKAQPDTREDLPRTYLALCVVARDDHALLWEWIMYHYRVLGIRRLYVFENNSTSTLLPKLLPLVQEGVVVYEYFSYYSKVLSYGSPQRWAYNECYRRWATHHEWLGFLDADEFLVLRDLHPSPAPALHPPPSLRNWTQRAQPVTPLERVVAEYEGAGGLSVSWMVFGSDGYTTPQPGVLGYYRRCSHHDHIKTLINTYLFHSLWGHPHNHNYVDGAVAVDEDGVHIPTANWTNLPSPTKTKRLAIYHYTIRSEQEYLAKVAKRMAWSRLQRDMGYFHAINEAVDRGYTPGTRCDDLDRYKDCFTITPGRDPAQCVQAQDQRTAVASVDPAVQQPPPLATTVPR